MKYFDTVTGKTLGSHSGLKKEISSIAVVQTKPRNCSVAQQMWMLHQRYLDFQCLPAKRLSVVMERSMFLCSAVQPAELRQCGAASAPSSVRIAASVNTQDMDLHPQESRSLCKVEWASNAEKFRRVQHLLAVRRSQTFFPVRCPQSPPMQRYNWP